MAIRKILYILGIKERDILLSLSQHDYYTRAQCQHGSFRYIELGQVCKYLQSMSAKRLGIRRCVAYVSAIDKIVSGGGC